MAVILSFEKLDYSQTPLTGRTITGKSRYPDENSYFMRSNIQSPDIGYI
jgi:hypothetical protein